MHTIEDVYSVIDTATFAQSEESDMKRSNANINTDTAMGAMLTYGAETAKMWVDDTVLPSYIKEWVDENVIYIHDKDFYGLTETCCQIELDKLFQGGFNTGHGYIREPQSITSAAALTCIALQSNQNEMHGGQAIPAIDWYLAPYVAKTYEKHLVEYTWLVNSVVDDKVELTSVPTLAWIKTREDTFQAMEALIHNLNTMHSRAGAQVPFSSINYGTCTSKEGQLVIEALLEATKKGLGHGETPIFPVQIFKVKEGVNYNEGEPNYWLFKKAMEVSAERLFPNFSFLDAPFNAQYYKEGDFNTEIAYMGCADAAENVTLYVDGEILNMGIGRAYDKYHDRDDVLVFDSTSGFVKVLTWVKNEDRGDWYKVKLSGGRCLMLTSDHPLPTNRGRIHVEDLRIGDEVPLAEYKESQFEFDPTVSPWLLGMLVCDSSYTGEIVVSVGHDEYDLVMALNEEHDGTTRVKHQKRGKKGDYYDVTLRVSEKLNKRMLEAMFGGRRKSERCLPNDFLMWSRESRMELLAGIIDADGHISTNKGCTVQIGSTNKELALQQLALAESLGAKSSLYENEYAPGKIRYRIEFQAPFDLKLRCAKKARKLGEKRREKCHSNKAKVVAVEFIGYRGKCSYDVETESDRFDLSGINSHNCRTRVMGNVNGEEVTGGRGNLSFTSINLVRLALEAKSEAEKYDMDEEMMLDVFETKVRDAMRVCVAQLLHRYEIQVARYVYNYPFLMGNGVWKDSEKLDYDDTLEEVLKHGSLSIGFIGLAEAMVALYGVHHGEDKDVWDIAKNVVEMMRQYCDFATEKHNLNFALIATPAEGLSGKFVAKDVRDFGVIEGVTDKAYYTNSFHLPVYYNCTAAEKIRKEAPFHALCNGGHITYVEVDGDVSNNIEAFEAIIRMMHDAGIGYGSVNHPVDRDPVCGYRGIIGDVCPCCGRREFEAVPDSYFD